MFFNIYVNDISFLLVLYLWTGE